METTLEIDARYVVSSFPTGSHTICNPPVTDTDIDTMILVTNLAAVESLLYPAGWERSGRVYPSRVAASWASYKKGNLNYLITDTLAYYNDFKTATELATKLNLREKEQRITLFNYILAEWEDDEL